MIKKDSTSLIQNVYVKKCMNKFKYKYNWKAHPRNNFNKILENFMSSILIIVGVYKEFEEFKKNYVVKKTIQ